MTRWLRMTVVVSLALSIPGAYGTEPDWAAMPYTQHAEYQAVNAFGEGTFPTVDPVKLRGVWVNRASDLLDPAPGANPFIGGQWQVYVQAVGDADFGGTACWMGQNIGKMVGNHPDGSYTDAEWLAELERLEHDPVTGHAFVPGDLVEVRARAPGMFYRGKTNVNEKHFNAPEMDYDIVLLEAGYGLVPATITLAYVKDTSDQFIFDPSRLSGAEWFQGTLVEILNVSFVSTAGWGPNAQLTIMDDTGRTLPVLLGRGAGFSTCPPPAGQVDLIGIFDQEATAGSPYTYGYRLWIPAATGYVRPHELMLTGDVDCSGAVGFGDINPFVLALTSPESYGADFPCCPTSNADIDGDGAVNFRDINPFVGLLAQP